MVYPTPDPSGFMISLCTSRLHTLSAEILLPVLTAVAGALPARRLPTTGSDSSKSYNIIISQSTSIFPLDIKSLYRAEDF